VNTVRAGFAVRRVYYLRAAVNYPRLRVEWGQSACAARSFSNMFEGVSQAMISE
jgi:hypothetical protein